MDSDVHDRFEKQFVLNGMKSAQTQERCLAQEHQSKLFINQGLGNDASLATNLHR